MVPEIRVAQCMLAKVEENNRELSHFSRHSLSSLEA